MPAFLAVGTPGTNAGRRAKIIKYEFNHTTYPPPSAARPTGRSPLRNDFLPVPAVESPGD